jgi:hypothetical protein
MDSFTNLGGRCDSSPVAGDVDGDGYPDLFLGIMAYELQPDTGKLIHYEYNPATGHIVEVRRRVVWHPCAGGLSLGDTDNDGTFELYMADRSIAGMSDGSWGRGLRSFWAENLTSRWDVYDNMMSSNIPMLVDVNKDGILDVVATDLSRGVMVLNSSDGRPLTNDEGTELRATNLPRRNHYQSSIYDIDGDGNLEILSGDGKEASYDNVTVWDLWDWTLDATINTTLVGGRSWKGPTVGNVTSDPYMDMIVVTFDINNRNNGTVQIYDHNFNLVYVNTGLQHRAIDAIVQDVDQNDGGLNELLVLTQGGRIYCYETLGAAANPRARSEVQFYSESRLGASEYVPYERVYPDVSSPSPSNGAVGVSTGLSTLSFRLNHPYGELMDYLVTCTPDIIPGSGTGTNVGNGIRTVPVSGLTASTTYVWQVDVTDDSGHLTSKTYRFTTGPYTPNSPPGHANPVISGSTDTEPLICTNQSTTDTNGDPVTNIYSWMKNGVSIANLILPFDTRTTPDLEYSGFAYTTDYSGYGNVGNVFGAAWTDDGVIGGAYTFDGNDFIRIMETGNTLGGNDESWSAITVEFWVKATTNTGNETLLMKHRRYSYSKGGGGFGGRPPSPPSGIGYQVDFAAQATYNQITWYIYTENATNPAYSIAHAVSAKILSGLQNWHHVVCTYTSGVGLKIYVDGLPANALPGVTGNIDGTNNSTRVRAMGTRLGDWGYGYSGGNIDTNKGLLSIGYDRNSGDFRGMLDDLRIYPAELSAAQIYQRYLETIDGVSPSSTIVPQETTVGETWRCNVTPTDSKQAGITRYAQVTLTTGVPHLTLQDVVTWSWSDTVITSEATADVDADGHIEIVTGGYYNDGVRDVAQLVVWDAETLTVEDVAAWYWTGDTRINAVAIGNVDSDGAIEVVTGGSYHDGVREVAQLVTWTGSTLAVEDIATWYWTGDTRINAVAIGNVDSDGAIEVVTGGCFNNTQDVAQLCIWYLN